MLFNGTVQTCADMLFDRTMNTCVCTLVRLDKYAYGGVLFGEEVAHGRAGSRADRLKGWRAGGQDRPAGTQAHG